MSGKIQNEDVKSEAELISAGATAASLPNDTKFYVTASGINKKLSQAITDSDIGGGGGTLTQMVLRGSSNFVVPAGVTSLKLYSKMALKSIIAGGDSKSGALKADGSAWTWGQGSSGNLGNNTTTTVSSPVAVAGGHVFASLDMGVSPSALKADGTAWGWGNNSSGQLGDNSTTNRSSPVAVAGGHKFIRTGSGNGYGLGLKADGSVWAWGENSTGKLGNNTLTDTSSPVAVAGGHSFVQIVAGGYVAMALKADGTLWTWGTGGFGTLGNNSNADQSSPVQVAGGHLFVDMVSLGLSALALKADGSVWGWGYNGEGELGNNSTTGRSSPVAVAGGHVFAKLGKALGDETGVALKADGSVWTWGQNNLGQLGNNSDVNTSSPVAVAGGHQFIEISTGGDTSFARKADGSVWGWGGGAFGQLGNNEASNKSSPVQIGGGNIFAPLNESNNRESLKETFLDVTPAQSIAYGTGPIGYFGTLQLGAGIESITVEYTA